MHEKIKRYCELIELINRKNEYLARERALFYQGGYSFEECHEGHLDELKSMEYEFHNLLKELVLTD